MTSSAIRLAALLALCPLSDAFTAGWSDASSLSSALRVSRTSEAVPDLASSTKPVDEANVFEGSQEEDEDSSWQKKLDLLLAPDTSVAERQIVLSDLLGSTDEIQDSVQTALRERKVSVSIAFEYCKDFLQKNCRQKICTKFATHRSTAS